MAINDYFLSKIGFAGHTNIMWWRWLVGRPVVEWWVYDWVLDLCECDSDWCWLVSHEVLQVTSGDIGVHKLEESIGVALLGEGNGDWSWLICDQVLKIASCDVGIHQLEESIGVALLGESNGDWCWLVGDQVLKVASCDVGIHKLE
jgi:hypothetical protein